MLSEAVQSGFQSIKKDSSKALPASDGLRVQRSDLRKKEPKDCKI